MPEPQPHERRRLQVSRPGVVVPVRIDPTGAGGPTPAQTRGRRWRSTSWGLYVPSEVDPDNLDQRIVEAAAALPAYGGVTGWAALAWAGGKWFDGLAPDGRTPLPVWLATSCADVRSQPGFRVSAEGLDPRDLTEIDGLPVTSLVRAVCFEMRYARSLALAVTALDMAAYSDLVSIDEARAYSERLRGRTGIPRCREAIELADENSWSPQEPPMRLVWEKDAGLPRPLCNVPVFDSNGRHVGTPDLLDPVAGVVGEYDGSLHLQGAQRSKDVRREGDFRRLGLEYVTMLAGDRADPGPFIGRLLEAYARAGRVPADHRTWNLTRPPWWPDDSTVAKRRALTGTARERLLRMRAA
jgi:hypothetical protein